MTAKRVAILVLLAAVAVVALLPRDWVAAQYHLARIRLLHRRIDVGVAMDSLVRLGPAGERALESIAFTREVATPGDAWNEVRSRALGVLFRREPDRHRLTAERRVRFIREARGLERDFLGIIYFERTGPGVEAVVEAALEAALTDPDDAAAVSAASYACAQDRALALRIGRESPILAARIAAFKSLPTSLLPDERRMLRRSLASADEDERVWAAITLVWAGDDGVGRPVLRANLRKSASSGTEYMAVLTLYRLRDRASIAAMIALDPRPDIDFELGELTGHKLAPGETWPAWWEAHRAEFPPQVDPDALPVGPLVVPEEP